jgi:hypothetical protein
VTTQSGERASLAYLPDYVDERRARAAEAGLVLEKQTRRQSMLSSWYSGSEAQFRAATFLRISAAFKFPVRIGGRKLYSLPVFCPAAPRAELKCTIAKTGDDQYRLAIVNEIMPVSWRLLGSKIEVYKYCDLHEGSNRGPATVYVGPLNALQAAGIAPPDAEQQLKRDVNAQRVCLWQAQPIESGRHRFVVHHEAEAKASAEDEERGRSNFKNPEQYQDWLLEVVAASIGMIRRQLRAKTKKRYIYTVPARTLKELETHFARLRKTIARSEVLVEKEDVRAEEQRAALRSAALAAMRDADFQRFLGKATTPLPRKR